MKDNQEIFHKNGKEDPAPSCKWWYKNDGNCRITNCFTYATPPGEENNFVWNLPGSRMFEDYDEIRSRCVSFRAGGSIDYPWYVTSVYNDEDENPHGLAQPGRIVATHANGLVEGHSTLEEYVEWLNDTVSAGKDVQQTASRREELASLKSMLVKGRAENVKVDITFEAHGVRNPDQHEQGPRLGKGVGYKYETTNSKQYSVTTSAEMGGAWEIFTASIGLSISETESYSVSEGLTFEVNCEKQGQVVFWPYYDYYDVYLIDTRERFDVWIPADSGDHTVSGEITINCLG